MLRHWTWKITTDSRRADNGHDQRQIVKGWRTRIGFLLPPGNPTVEPEMAQLTPPGVSLHFTRMNAEGPAGTHSGQEERNRSQVESIPGCVRLLAMVSPSVIVMAHTATSYTLGEAREAALVAEMEALGKARFITAFGSVLAALNALGVRRIAYATPYSAEMTAQGRRHIETCDIEVVSSGHLSNVRNIYEENSERAYAIGRQVDHPDAEAIFLSGVGMPTLDALQPLEDDTGKPVISAASAMMWHALRTAGIRHVLPGFGRLLAGNT
jgi:maleate cis-trans isomerase